MTGSKFRNSGQVRRGGRGQATDAQNTFYKEKEENLYQDCKLLHPGRDPTGLGIGWIGANSRRLVGFSTVLQRGQQTPLQ